MQATIVSVGTELLLGQIVDTNAAYLSRVLAACGLTLYRRFTVGDNRKRLQQVLVEASAESDILFTIGGLGPTMDDLTRDVLAEVFCTELVEDPQIASRLSEFFSRRGQVMPASNLRQAMVPRNGFALPNPNGTAPGLVFEAANKMAIALPGPPAEFIPMLEEQVLPLVKSRSGSSIIHSRLIRICGLGESLVEEKVADLMRSENPSLAPYASSLGEVHLRATAYAESAAKAEELVEKRVQEVLSRIGSYVYGFDDNTLEQVVLRLLNDRGLSVATAESCTGGLLSKRLTDSPGSSSVFLGGVVSYANEAKSKLLAVPASLLQEKGAVSEEVALAMASGVRSLFGAHFGISITGIAGPGGGSPEKPLGLVYMALSSAKGSFSKRFEFLGKRDTVRERSAHCALNLLREAILSL